MAPTGEDIRYTRVPPLTGKKGERFSQFLRENGLTIAHVEDLRIAQAAFEAGWLSHKEESFKAAASKPPNKPNKKKRSKRR